MSIQIFTLSCSKRAIDAEMTLKGLCVHMLVLSIYGKQSPCL